MNSAAKMMFGVGLALVTASGAFAKAHDNGVADGDPSGIGKGTAGVIGDAVSSGVSGGARGDQASTAKSDNRVEPVTPDKE